MYHSDLGTFLQKVCCPPQWPGLGVESCWEEMNLVYFSKNTLLWGVSQGIIIKDIRQWAKE